MAIKTKYYPSFFLLGFSLVFIFSFYGNIILSPNDYLFSNSGDGIKNYFTYAYQIKYNSSFGNFEGMNYPYGESFLYTDSHPILASSFQYLAKNYPFFQSHSIGILNLFLIASIWLSFIILYLLLLELKLKHWLAALFSITIVLLAPQVFRLDGHLALSYSLAIPLTWYLFLRLVKTTKWPYLLLLLLNNLFWLFIHAYLGVIAMSFLACLLVFYFLSEKGRLSAIPIYFGIAFSLILPLIFFSLLSVQIEEHDGRTDNPSGFFLYNAEIDDLFVPYAPPLRPILDDLTNESIKLEWEARSYVGLFNTLLLPLLLILLLLAPFWSKARNAIKRVFNNRMLNLAFLASIPLLLFAMAVPFRNYPEFLEQAPILKQFRATGRFTWPFYFAYTVFAAYGFQQLIWLHERMNPLVKKSLLAVIIVFTFWEGLPGHLMISEKITAHKNLFNAEQMPELFKRALEQFNPEDYQAIIALPFYHQGSESFSRPRQEASVRNSILLSYYTGLPNVGANLTRVAVPEAKKIVQMLGPSYYEKEIQRELNDKRPFLILKTGNQLNPYENNWIKKSQVLYSNSNIEFLRLEKAALFVNTSQDIIREFELNKDSVLHQRGDFYLTDSSSFLYYKDFNEHENIKSYRGKGSYSGSKKGGNILAEFDAYTFQADSTYSISIWMHNGEKDALNLWFRFIIQEYDKEAEQWLSTTLSPEHAAVIDRDWSLVEGEFQVKDARNPIKVLTIGKENSKASFYADDLLIVKKGVDVYYEDTLRGTLLYNNHRLLYREFY